MTAFIKGFSAPIHDSQQTFRQALLAMSEPGKWQTIAPIEPIEMLNSATVSLILSLLDADTTLWLQDDWQTADVSANLTFHAGCKVTSDQTIADFGIYDLEGFLAAESLEFSQGDDRYPDQSATLIIQLPESAETFRSCWQGPGIRDERICELPIPAAFWQKRADLISFPCGIDFIFTQGNQILALPRTTKIFR